MKIPVPHLPRLLDHLLKGQQTNGLLAWSLVMLLVAAFLLPYFLFNQIFIAIVTYGSLALVPLCLAAYFRERLGVLVVWGVILLGMACSLLINHGTSWPAAVLNNFLFGNLVGLFVGLILAQFFHMNRQIAAARLLFQVQEREADRQREAKELQVQLNSLKDQLIFHLSHELRNPLTAVQGYLELLRTYHHQLDEAQRADFFERAGEGCAELLYLITNVLDVDRIEKQQDLPLEPIALAQVVRNMVDQWDPRTRQVYEIDLEVSEHIIVQANPGYLLQVLRNLFSNALKYSPPRSRVVISATRDNADHQAASHSSVCVGIKDEGPGIPATEIPVLFNKFTRLKRDLAGPVPGTGLGLYICKQLVEAMGGTIWVESSGQAGEGSRFCFLLPMAAPDRVPLENWSSNQKLVDTL